VKAGDVLSFYDTDKHREVRVTVSSVEPSIVELEDYVRIRFRRRKWCMHEKRTRIMRVRRLAVRKAKEET
jgi:hypothetical protein